MNKVMLSLGRNMLISVGKVAAYKNIKETERSSWMKYMCIDRYVF